MGPVTRVEPVFEAIQKVKANAPGFCTNFFPLERKLREWIDHAELFAEVCDDASFFLRKDRDFWHLYFCAATLESLRRKLLELPILKQEPVVVDLIGNENGLKEMLNLIQSQNFRPYQKLYRMARMAQATQVAANCALVSVASPSDAPAIWDLLCRSFDRYAEQLPMLYDVEAAIDNHQVLVAKQEKALAGLLFYETQGLTSAVRYWLVDESFRGLRLGSALMQCYFAAESAARRFILWVLADNDNAIQKYQHYGYAADGLVDHVLANKMIRA